MYAKRSSGDVRLVGRQSIWKKSGSIRFQLLSPALLLRPKRNPSLTPFEAVIEDALREDSSAEAERTIGLLQHLDSV